MNWSLIGHGQIAIDLTPSNQTKAFGKFSPEIFRIPRRNLNVRSPARIRCSDSMI
jgi:hypothetical protein